MKKQYGVSVIMIVLLAAISLLSTGCAAPGQTRKEVDRRHMNAIKTQTLQFQDDVDAFLLIDRPSRLSPMYVR